jgi:hypothetical protein
VILTFSACNTRLQAVNVKITEESSTLVG